MSDKKPHLVTLKSATDQVLSKGIGGKLAQQMTNNLGRQYMAIVEVEVDVIHHKGEQDVADLRVLQFWPATDDLSHYLRDVTAAMHREAGFTAQKANGDQPLFDGGSEPTVEGVLAGGGRFRPHPYLAAMLGVDDEAICDVCGQIEDVPVHRVLADEHDGPEGDDQLVDGDGEQPEPEEEPVAEPEDPADPGDPENGDGVVVEEPVTELRPAPVANPFAPTPTPGRSGVPDDVA
jgi:hypothetical protein